MRKTGNAWRGTLAAAMVILSALAAYFVFGRDVDWARRSREARDLGRTAELNGHYGRARLHFDQALASHPYDWTSHLALGDLLYRHLNDQDGALRHYLLALAYSPDAAIERETEAKIRLLELMRTGELEDPRNALEDMYLAVENDAFGIFSRRLSPAVRADAQAYWEGWRERGRGRIAYCRVESSQHGFYDAMVELDFPDGTAMAMHFTCPLRDLWRLQVSFP